MTRRLVVGIAVVLVVAGVVACNKQATDSTYKAPTSSPMAPDPVAPPNVSVDGFVGDWQADPVVDPDAIAAAEAIAARSCSHVEFRAVRDVDSRTAVVMFAATCARVRIRAEGRGQMSGDTLVWRASGQVTLPNSRTCGVAFGDGNKAQPAAQGLVKVTYNGRVCDAAVSGTALVRRR